MSDHQEHSNGRIEALVESVGANVLVVSAQVETLRGAVEKDKLDMREVQTTLGRIEGMVDRLNHVVLTGNGEESLKSICSRLTRTADANGKAIRTLEQHVSAAEAEERKGRNAVLVAIVFGSASVAAAAIQATLTLFRS